jgi:benzoyl-CoA reductase/2-hydroxyglutaryl-CoA dehydratase subunit BcrC/BadD/HgdB
MGVISMDMPKNFENFTEARRNGFIKVKNAKDEGKKVVGTFCTFTPWEVIYAAGAIPITVCGMSDETTEDAEKHLPKNLCPLIKSSYGFAITDKCPYIYFSDMLVGETTCDGKKKMYELLGKIKNMHVMQLPQNSTDKASLELWKTEIIKLKERLEKDFQVEITDEMLKEAIKIRNEEREVLKEFYSLSKLNPPAMWGYDLHKVIDGTNFSMDKKLQTVQLKDMINDIKAKYERGETSVDKDAKRILITGCPSGGVLDKVIKTIEESGAVVVCLENCTGIKEKYKLVREDIDPIDALVEKYISVPCSVMSPNNGRLEFLSELIDEYKVDGVVDITLQACHTYAVESFTVKEFVNKEKGLPYLNLETNYSPSDLGQIKTRIEAFIEMM